MQLSELISVTITIPPRDIEPFLDALAVLPHHINVSLRYEETVTHVEFPAWRWWLDDLFGVLGGFAAARLRYRPAVALGRSLNVQERTNPAGIAG